MLFDESRLIWKDFTTKISPLMDLYSQLRPLIFLPFNIWLFFVTLPFRVFFMFTSVFYSDSKKPISMEFKEKLIEVKRDLLSETSQSDSLRRRSGKSEKRSEEVEETTADEPAQSEEQADEIDEQPKEATFDETPALKEQLSHYEERERSTLESMKKLESEFEELSKKFNDDEKVLASFDHEKQRFRQLIHVEQKKCFDFQQQIISLKNQLKSEHESKVKAEEQINSIKKQKRIEKRQAHKAAAKSEKQSSVESSTPIENSKPATSDAQVPAEHGAWHTPAHLGFTEMVAQAQKEEQEHGKTFSEVLKEAIKPEVHAAPSDEKTEFTVVGGDLSSQHVYGKAPVSAV